MKSLKKIGLAVISAAILIGFASCKNSADGTTTEPPHRHTYESEVTTKETCTTDGVRTYKCTTCGDTYTEVIAAHHTWDAGEVTKEPTCTEEGKKKYTCTVCKANKTETLAKTPHTYGDLTVDSTAGTGTKTCSVCHSDWLGPMLKAGGSREWGGEFQKALKNNLGVTADSNDSNVTKVVFGLLSDSKISAKVATLAKKTEIGAVDGTCNAYAEEDGENLIIYIVPADEDATGFVFNADSSCIFSTFVKCEEIAGLDLVDTSQVTNMYSMFSGCSGLTSLDLSGFDTSKVTNMYSMFGYCSALTSLDLSGFDTSKVTNMFQLFIKCSGLTELNVSNFNTSNVTDMVNMFNGCSGLTELNVSNFNTSNVTTMGSMFNGCSGLESLNVSNFDTRKVEDMSSMFNNCSGLTELDVSGFDTSNVTYMVGMFYNCRGLTSLDVSNFDTRKVENMNSMFSGCSGLTSLDVSGFDTSNVTNMGVMFYDCSGLTELDLSGKFDTTNVTDARGMFWRCSGLATIYVADADNVPENLQNAKPSSATFVTK